ncbi:MAG: hypothetical protein ACYTXY_00405 [Nostoc sp.]
MYFSFFAARDTFQSGRSLLLPGSCDRLSSRLFGEHIIVILQVISLRVSVGRCCISGFILKIFPQTPVHRIAQVVGQE